MLATATTEFFVSELTLPIGIVILCKTNWSKKTQMHYVQGLITHTLFHIFKAIRIPMQITPFEVKKLS